MKTKNAGNCEQVTRGRERRRNKQNNTDIKKKEGNYPLCHIKIII